MLLCTASIAIVLGLALNSLRTAKVEQFSNGTCIAFKDESVAREAQQISFQLQVDDLNIDVLGGSTVIWRDNSIDYMVSITGHTKQTVPDLKRVWPFSQRELGELIRKEIDKRLEGDSGARFVSCDLPVD